MSMSFALFRQAIDAIVTRRGRVLVVQRTGWGKSLIYFLSTKLLREQEGPNRARMRCSADLNQLAGAGTPGKQGFSNKYG